MEGKLKFNHNGKLSGSQTVTVVKHYVISNFWTQQKLIAKGLLVL